MNWKKIINKIEVASWKWKCTSPTARRWHKVDLQTKFVIKLLMFHVLFSFPLIMLSLVQ